MNVLCFSLWGSAPKYTLGMLENAKLAPIIYPGWEVRCYVGASVPKEIITQLIDLSVNVISKPENGDWMSMFWRFEAMCDWKINACVSRDADSRISKREKVAVDEWLASGNTLHVIRDHPWHAARIMGGMWGVRPFKLPKFKEWMDEYMKTQAGDYWQTDQNFLRDVVWPNVPSNEKFVHDEFFASKSTAHRIIPVSRAIVSSEGLRTTFIGQVWFYDASGNQQTVGEHIAILQQFMSLPPQYRIENLFE